jgi:hypothetical protein
MTEEQTHCGVVGVRCNEKRRWTLKTHQRNVNQYVINCIAAVLLLTGALIGSAEAQELSGPREKALHDCNVWAYNTWNMRDWMSAQITNYRDCITERGQAE